MAQKDGTWVAWVVFGLLALALMASMSDCASPMDMFDDPSHTFPR